MMEINLHMCHNLTDDGTTMTSNHCQRTGREQLMQEAIFLLGIIPECLKGVAT